MNQFGTDVTSMAAVVGGAVVALVGTWFSLAGAEPEQDRCFAEGSPDVVVAMSHFGRDSHVVMSSRSQAVEADGCELQVTKEHAGRHHVLRILSSGDLRTLDFDVDVDVDEYLIDEIRWEARLERDMAELESRLARTDRQLAEEVQTRLQEVLPRLRERAPTPPSG